MVPAPSYSHGWRVDTHSGRGLGAALLKHFMLEGLAHFGCPGAVGVPRRIQAVDLRKEVPDVDDPVQYGGRRRHSSGRLISTQRRVRLGCARAGFNKESGPPSRVLTMSGANAASPTVEASIVCPPWLAQSTTSSPSTENGISLLRNAEGQEARWRSLVERSSPEEPGFGSVITGADTQATPSVCISS